MDDDVVSGCQKSNRGCFRSHPRAEGKAVRSAFEGGNAVFQRFARWIARAGVIKRPHLLHALVGKRRYLVNRLHNRTVRRVRRLTGMNGKRFKFHTSFPLGLF
jgi:hypothetical protein